MSQSNIFQVQTKNNETKHKSSLNISEYILEKLEI